MKTYEQLEKEVVKNITPLYRKEEAESVLHTALTFAVQLGICKSENGVIYISREAESYILSTYSRLIKEYYNAKS